MNRRSLGRGRLVIGAGAVLALVGCLFPWGQTAGVGLPPESTGAFDGFGILVFVAAIGLLALIALPYAAGDQPIGLDRPLAFVIVGAVGVIGFLLKLIQILGAGLLALPDKGLGLWVAAVGLVIVIWGLAEMAAEHPRA
ncbi:MAG: hypothetical protein M0Z49_11540 [Chloroflexi bacterium]|nr:hypothetical protein [Chloroflexota bacterium]